MNRGTDRRTPPFDANARTAHRSSNCLSLSFFWPEIQTEPNAFQTRRLLTGRAFGRTPAISPHKRRSVHHREASGSNSGGGPCTQWALSIKMQALGSHVIENVVSMGSRRASKRASPAVARAQYRREDGARVSRFHRWPVAGHMVKPYSRAELTSDGVRQDRRPLDLEAVVSFLR